MSKLVLALVLLAAVACTVAVTLGVSSQETVVSDRMIWFLMAASIAGATCATILAVGDRIVREVRAGQAVERILRDEDSSNVRRVRP